MCHSKRWGFVAGIAIAFSISPRAEAGDARSTRWEDAWTFSLHHENDLFLRTDQYYTSGTKISWLSPNLHHTFNETERIPNWLKPAVGALPFVHDPGVRKNVSFSFGQSMYTPADLSFDGLGEEDRPYAGWLYGAVALHNRTARWTDTVELSLGVVGPMSLAEDVQRWVHKVRGLAMPHGWEHQIRNEPTLNVVWERKVRHRLLGHHRGFAADSTGHVGAALGNVYTYGNFGGGIRAGWNLPQDYGSAAIRMAGETNAPVEAGDPRLQLHGAGWGLHLFAVFDGRIMLRDITLDGNTFRDSHSVDREWLVGDASAGLAGTYRQVKLSYAVTYRSPTFVGGDAQLFGSLNFSWTY